MMKHVPVYGWAALAAILALAAGPGGAAADDTAERVTFSNEVARIFQKNCQECHRPGELAPMSLMTYQDTRPWAKSIRKTVAERTMPPWHADSRYGAWVNDISLTDAEIDTILRWVDQGAPEGDPKNLPAEKAWPKVEWKLGEPDLALFPSAPYTLPASVEDEYRCFVLPLGLDEDRWVTAFEYRPTNRVVVHHIIGFLDVNGKALERDLATPEPGFLCGAGGGVGEAAGAGMDAMIGGWAPGTPPNKFREGIGKVIPKGANIVLQMHYHNESGLDQVDQSGIGIHFAKSRIDAKARIMPVSAWRLNIRAGDPNAEAKAQWRVPRDITLFSIMPHMHYLGKDMTVSVTYPDGSHEILLSVPRFDFNWQTVYGYPEPKLVPKGSIMHMIAHHDNSAENPRNPSNPPKDVKWGEATTDEMAIGWIGYTFSDEKLNIDPAASKNVGSAESKTGTLAAKAD